MFRLVLEAPNARHPDLVTALRPYDILLCEPDDGVLVLGVARADGAPEAAHAAGARVMSSAWIEEVAEAAEEAEVAEEAAEGAATVEDAVEEEAALADADVDAGEAEAAEEAEIAAEVIDALPEIPAEAPVEDPAPFLVRLSGARATSLVDEGLALCRALSGAVEFSEPPTAWDGADWTIRGVGAVSAVRAACGSLACGAVVEAA